MSSKKDVSISTYIESAFMNKWQDSKEEILSKIIVFSDNDNIVVHFCCTDKLVKNISFEASSNDINIFRYILSLIKGESVKNYKSNSFESVVLNLAKMRKNTL